MPMIPTANAKKAAATARSMPGASDLSCGSSGRASLDAALTGAASLRCAAGGPDTSGMGDPSRANAGGGPGQAPPPPSRSIQALDAERLGRDLGLAAVEIEPGGLADHLRGFLFGIRAIDRREDGGARGCVFLQRLGVLDLLRPDHFHGLDDVVGRALRCPDAEIV